MAASALEALVPAESTRLRRAAERYTSLLRGPGPTTYCFA
jgi:hypothetical protein